MSKLWEHETQKKIEHLTLERDALAEEYKHLSWKLATKDTELKRLNWVRKVYKEALAKLP